MSPIYFDSPIHFEITYFTLRVPTYIELFAFIRFTYPEIKQFFPYVVTLDTRKLQRGTRVPTSLSNK